MKHIHDHMNHTCIYEQILWTPFLHCGLKVGWWVGWKWVVPLNGLLAMLFLCRRSLSAMKMVCPSIKHRHTHTQQFEITLLLKSFSWSLGRIGILYRSGQMDLSGRSCLKPLIWWQLYTQWFISVWSKKWSNPGYQMGHWKGHPGDHEILEDKAQGSHKGAINLNRFTGQSNPLQTSINQFSS